MSKTPRTLMIEVETLSGQNKEITQLLDFLRFKGNITSYKIVELIQEDPVTALFNHIQVYKDTGSLVRLKANKLKGGKIDIACRIIDLNSESKTIIVYDVDKKVIENINAMEIDDLIPAT